MKLSTKIILKLAGLLTAGFHSISYANEQPIVLNTNPELPEMEQFDLYLLVGQSNMAGRGAVGEDDRQPVKGILVFSQSDQWVWQGEPIHFDRPPLIGVGLGFAFAKEMKSQSPDKTVGLIPCAVGGTAISEWMPGKQCFEDALRRARLAMPAGQLKGILWHQGESDSGNRRASSYGKNLGVVVEAFRRELNAQEVPFIAGKLGSFLYNREDGKYPFAAELNVGIESLPDLIPNSAVVSADGLKDKGDSLHFDAESLKIFGKRYADAFQKLQKP